MPASQNNIVRAPYALITRFNHQVCNLLHYMFNVCGGAYIMFTDMFTLIAHISLLQRLVLAFKYSKYSHRVRTVVHFATTDPTVQGLTSGSFLETVDIQTRLR